ncbi:DMT family transporter [Modestobacter excelsi]|uniref:DMT family transporter n=1 Tax=Modestobacter excelsi TaxID=2213161 RepID=UPI00110CBB21|nr:DMT family transporter [Modestobacter excelsi]
MSAPTRVRNAAVAAAPLLFVLLWSTGFVGAKYGLPYAEPFTFLALRLGLAGALLAVLTAVLRSGWPAGRTQVGRAGVAGLLLHAGYLGGVFFAIHSGLPASVAAVVTSLQPVLTAALATRLLGERLVAVQWLGLALGVGGVVLVLAPGLVAAAGEEGALPPVGVVSCLVALLCGTAGTLWQKQHGDDIPLLSGTVVQYVAAALALVAVARLTEDMAIEWTAEFVLALVWLVVPLSLGAVLLLLFLLRRGSASGVSSLLFLVPPATAVEAHLLFGERLPLLSLAGVVVTTVGVALVLRPPGRRTARRATMGA